jgi:hypothetical protein
VGAERGLLGVLLLLAAFLLGNLIAFGSGRDQGVFLAVADAMLRGEAPYRGAWDIKPPGIYFLYAWVRALFGPGMTAVRVFEAIGLASVILAAALYSRRHAGSARAGVLAGVSAIAAYVPLEFWDTAQPEGYGAMALVWALVLATYRSPGVVPDGSGPPARQLLAWIGAASLTTIAALLKPPLGGAFVVGLAFVLLDRWRQNASSGGKPRDPARRLVPPLLAFLVGGAIPLLATLGYFIAKGALGDLIETLFVFVPRYAESQFRLAPMTVHLGRTLQGVLIGFALYNLPGLVAFVLLPPLHRRERSAALHAAAVAAVALLGVALQARFFPYHYTAAIVLLAIPAGWGYWKIWRRVRASLPGTTALVVGLALLPRLETPAARGIRHFGRLATQRVEVLRNPEEWPAVSDRLSRKKWTADPATVRRAAEWLTTHTPPGSAIYVWGYAPLIYIHARRPCASRYVYNYPQRVEWGREEARRRLIEDLRRSPPAAIVIERGDVMPWITGTLVDSFQELRGFPELVELLALEYRLAEKIDCLDVWARSAEGPG